MPGIVRSTGGMTAGYMASWMNAVKIPHRFLQNNVTFNTCNSVAIFILLLLSATRFLFLS